MGQASLNRRAFWQLVALGAPLLAGGSSACRAGGRPAGLRLRVATPVAETPGWARVTLTEIDSDIFKFMVLNLSSEPMVILRDEVLLVSPRGTLRREPGGLSNIYNVGPFHAHDVNVRYDLTRIQPGERLHLRFENALLIKGHPFGVPPIVVDA